MYFLLYSAATAFKNLLTIFFFFIQHQSMWAPVERRVPFWLNEAFYIVCYTDF